MSWIGECNRCGEQRFEQKAKPRRCRNLVRHTPRCERRCDRNLIRVRPVDPAEEVRP